ncbi:hypothetical protein NDU88_004494 [Pleurodeles waltl]|uniref:Uncharacterized protein n=1 Tax=Pleurodeles waltl TaxID=8319 RepID=A0AAV7WVN9_PLEWA|nr:hypothetical protein NDU88_004494 [Pleurodeles waltl]
MSAGGVDAGLAPTVRKQRWQARTEDAEESTIRWWGRCGPVTHNEDVPLGNKERSRKCAPWRLAEDVEGWFRPSLTEGTLRGAGWVARGRDGVCGPSAVLVQA